MNIQWTLRNVDTICCCYDLERQDVLASTLIVPHIVSESKAIDFSCGHKSASEFIKHSPCCVHNASTVPWTSAGQFGRPRGVRGRPWYDLWRPRCVISHPMDVRGLPPGRPPSGRPRDTQFGIDWSLLPSGCPQGVRTAEVQPITARTHYGQEVGLPTVRPKPEVDVP